MNYLEAMDYINEKNKLGSVPGLENIKELLRLLGNPQQRCRCLHIAGTNGKGSIFAYVDSILQEAGFTTGRYISPTIFDYLERFLLNGKSMLEEEFSQLLERVKEKVDIMQLNGMYPTAFEIETAIAFLFFDIHRVDYVLIECGMGGRLDATNVLEDNVASVIASISMDHMQFLGNNILDIAREKAGIIKPDGICILAPQTKRVEHFFEEYCAKINTRLIKAAAELVNIHEMTADGTEFDYEENDYEISLLGEHQVYNAITAIETVRLIDGITIEAVQRGLRKTTWPGRLTRVHSMPAIYVDGAHNEDAWRSLKKAVNYYFTNRRIIYIIGVLRDKEYQKLADILGETMSEVITVTPDSPRALPKEELAAVIAERNIPVSTAGSSSEAIQKAMEAADINDVILVCGSLSFIADYLRLK